MHAEMDTNVEALQAMMGGTLDAGLAKRTLMKHSGDIDSAAAELLDMQDIASSVGRDTTTDTNAWNLNLDSELPSYPSSTYAPQRPNTPRIVERQY